MPSAPIALRTCWWAALTAAAVWSCTTPAPGGGGSAVAGADANRVADSAGGGDAARAGDTAVAGDGTVAAADFASPVADAVPDGSAPDSSAGGEVAGADAGTVDGPLFDAAQDSAPPTDAAAKELPSAKDAQPDAIPTADADGKTADVAPVGPPTSGKCKPGAPGFDSCIVQALFQCILPTPTCASTLQKDGAFETKWDGGGSFACFFDEKSGLVSCEAKGPDGKPCAQFALNIDMATKTASATLTAGATVHTMAFVDKGITVTCAGGKVEVYASDDELCSPLKMTPCGADIDVPPDPNPCPPQPAPPPCKAGGVCGSYVCDPATNTCLVPCAPDGSCPPCTLCDPASGGCTP